MWSGSTTPANADAYEALLREEVFARIADRKIPGYRGIQLLRAEEGSHVKFVTLMWFDSMDCARTFAGEDVDRAVVPPEARALLRRWDARSKHYAVADPGPIPEDARAH